MTYFYNTPDDQQQMLQAIGLDSLDALFDSIPAELRMQRALDVPAAMGELELTAHLTELAGRNSSPAETISFLGGGSYDHFVPAVVDYVGARGEFYTSYTPYQPEVSQGNLQAMFEYQTMICQLTGMEVANQSLYDGGSAAAEAVLMAMSVTRRHGRVVTAGSVHPEYRQIVETYFANLDTQLVTLATPDGTLPPATLESALTDDTACVLIQHPNFFGCLEEVEQLAEITHRAGALLVVVADPISLGILKRPGDYGADVVVAEGQCLGTPMQFGGPYLGIMACREKFVRRMPGRIAGQTLDRQGRRCWVLTLQTREQHIRREKATSNICTNQGLFALRASVYLAAMGPEGMRQVAQLCLHKARYAQAQLFSSGRLEPVFAAPTFKEFVVRDRQGDVDGLLADALSAGFMAGVPLGRWYPQLSDCALVSVTEKRTQAQIDALAQFIAQTSQAETALHAKHA
ncbi:MAG: aminomethyl-transferring glycine dehydrogenase subunit GcvPA [Planctomycetota bacterium]|nr:aminomethyl-transferring glycine dehydrogenase subunit GcvPA [Planctomycetota bacterium]